MNNNQLFQLAIEHHKAGSFQDAERLYLAVLRVEPAHADANYNMGLLAVQTGRADVGLPFFLAALEAEPAQGKYWLGYIDALFQSGQLTDAEQVLALARQQGLQGADVDALAQRLQAAMIVLNNIEHDRQAPGNHEMVSLCDQGQVDGVLIPMQKAAALSPNDVEAQCNLGSTLHKLGRLVEAEACYRGALQIVPDLARGHCSLGNVLRESGRLDEAEASYRTALLLKPDYLAAYANLGLLLLAFGRLDESGFCCRQALRMNPDVAELHNILGATLKESGRLLDAEASYRRALQLKPDYAEACSNLGYILFGLGRLEEAQDYIRRALQIKPDFADAYCNLGIVLVGLESLAEAENCFGQAIHIAPDHALAHCNLACMLIEMGRLEEAEASLRQALLIKPDYALAHSNLIFARDLMTGLNPAALFDERCRWNTIHAVHLHQQRAHGNIADPNRRLRIGYVSADFRVHSAAYAFGAMLVDFDPELFDVIAYSNSRVQDVMTHRFQKSVTFWRNIVGLSDDAVADLIREDQIDILVDLSGHTAGNRLLVFARKSAPIQITAWGYAAGTGMTAMDVLFADPVVVPPEDKRFFSEQVVYLPSMIASFDMKASPAVNTLPALSGKGITFGSFNRLVKNSRETYCVWAKILHALPGSRMMIKTQALDDAATRARVMAHFTDAGIDSSRIVLLGKTTREEHLAAYNQIDLALDPFPHGGGVTALEGLVMGIPLVTLRWPTLAGRVSASIMTSMGLPDWIAETQDQYVDLAVQKAGDLQSLAELRHQLPEIFRVSAIGDQKSYVRAVEQEYRKLWQQWCVSAAF